MKEIVFIEKSISLESGTRFDGKGKIYTGTKPLTQFYLENGVFVCDLKKAGISPLPMSSRGFSRPFGRSHSELFIKGKPCAISRYPKTGAFLRIKEYAKPFTAPDEIASGDIKEGFYYEDERAKSWSESKDIWVHGYWGYDWANSYEQIDEFDKEKGFIKTRPPYGNYYYRKNQRFYFLNIKEEVTGAGDYCIDYEKGKLYFLPFEKDCLDDVRLSVSSTPCFYLENKENIVVENCVIDGFAGDGIFIKNCKNILFKNCVIRNIGSRGALVEDGENVLFENCEFYHIGDRGVDIKAGNRATLKEANSGVLGCKFHDISAWSRTYSPAVHLTGVGLFAKGNTIYDCPHTAIMYWGNEMKITENIIYHVLWETGDAGAIYSGRDYTFRGNEVSDNLICLTGGVGMGTMGIYNDDCVSGTKMEGNVFYKVQRALFLGGGIDFVVKNNLCVECTPAVALDMRGASVHPQWRENMQTLKERFYNIADGVSGIDEPYISRYPELKKLHETFENEKDSPLIPASGEIAGNVFYGWGIRVDWMPNSQDFEENFVCENNVDVRYFPDLKDLVSEKQYAKYLQALEIEKELKCKN